MGTKFTLSFSNFAGISYCEANRNCANDGHQYVGSSKAKPKVKRGLERHPARGGIYDTQDGRTILVPNGAFPGDIVWTPQFGDHEDDITFEQDTITGPSNSTGYDEDDYEEY